MKKSIITAALLCAAYLATAGEPTKRDVSDMKSVAEFSVKQALMKTSEPVKVGQDRYAVSVTVAGKSCKVTLKPEPDDGGPWRWKATGMDCR